MFLKELGKTRKRVQKSVFADELILEREHHKQAGILTTTSHGTSRFVSERRFGMGCPSHLQVCYRFKKPTVFIV